MVLNHIALVCSSEENSDKFYEKILGLKKMETKIIPSTLSKQIFNLDTELKIVNYANDNIRFEIFIDKKKSVMDKRAEHVCLEVADLKGFLVKCKSMGVLVKQIPKGDAFLIFIKDYDGNLFEIKNL